MSNKLYSTLHQYARILPNSYILISFSLSLIFSKWWIRRFVCRQNYVIPAYMSCQAIKHVLNIIINIDSTNIYRKEMTLWKI